MMKLLHFVFAVLSTFMGTLHTKEKDLGYSMNIIGEVIGTIMDETVTEMEQEFPYLSACGGGGGWSKDNTYVTEEFIAFQVRKKLTQEQGASLIVKFTNNFLSKLYKEKKWRFI